MTTLIKKDVSDEKTKCTYSSEWFSYWYHGWCMNHKNSNIFNSLKIRRICVGFLFKTNRLDIFVIIWWHGLYPLSLVYLSPIWCRGINTITWTSCILNKYLQLENYYKDIVLIFMDRYNVGKNSDGAR